MTFFSRIVLFLLFFLIMVSCNTDKICNEDRTSYLRIGFYQIYTNSKNVKSVQTDTIKDASIFGLDRSDSLLYNKINVSKLVLPLAQMKDSCIFEIRIGSNIFDKYLIKYKRSQTFVNYECGFRTDFEIDTLISTMNKIDSLYFNTRIVTNNIDEQIKVFFTVDSNNSIQP